MRAIPQTRLFLGVAAIMALLWVIDQFLARLEQREVAAEAASLYREGQTATKDNRVSQAIDAFSHAHSLLRDDERYSLALADALTRNRELDVAEGTLADLLEDNSNDGNANLHMARVRAAQGRSAEAESFYHRAIYGAWPAERQHDARLAARLELVNFLASKDESQSLLAELLPLEDEAATHEEVSRQIPRLFEAANSPARAASAYQRLLQRNPNDVEALAGLGRAELELGNFRAAQSAFARAAQRHPSEKTVVRGAMLASEALALDPTPRRLSGAVRLERSSRILRLTIDNAKACAVTNTVLISAAEALLVETRPVHELSEAAEARLESAETLWKSRARSCSETSGDAELVSILMRKASQ